MWGGIFRIKVNGALVGRQCLVVALKSAIHDAHAVVWVGVLWIVAARCAARRDDGRAQLLHPPCGGHGVQRPTSGDVPRSPFRSSERGRDRGRENWIVTWLHGDSLGSASIATNASGAKISELRYSPFGEVRYAWNQTATDKRFIPRLANARGGTCRAAMRARTA